MPLIQQLELFVLQLMRTIRNRDSDIDSIVTVYHTGKIMAPCGMGRELIADYSIDALVILEDNSGISRLQYLIGHRSSTQ